LRADVPLATVVNVTDDAYTFLDSIAARTLLAAVPDACLIVDSTGLIRAANDTAHITFAAEPGRMVGRSVEDFLPEPDRARHRGLRARYNHDPHAREMGFGLELRALRREGDSFPVDISLSPIDVDGETYTIVSIRDITDATMLRQQVARTRREAALAEERERMARDLHDTVIQEVFAVGLSLQSLSGRSDDPTLTSRLHEAIEDLDRVIRDIRTAIFGLTNDDAWGRGFRGVILGVGADQAPSLGFEPSIDFQGPVDEIPAPIQQQLIPCLREALSNVARHASARRCDVVVSVDRGEAGEDGTVELRVEDDGVGLNEHGGTSRGAGNGLANMAARAEELGGTCQVVSGVDGGTTIAWLVPGSHS
jgi:PAS domain S-box-containing protein